MTGIPSTWRSVHRRRYSYIKFALLLFVLLNLLFLINVDSKSWGGYVKTDSDYWSISRESNNLNFNYYSSIEANCHKTNVTTSDRVADIRSSVRTSVSTTDTTFKESTSANEGTYRSMQAIQMMQAAEKDVNMSISKDAGSSRLNIFWDEQWPSRLVFAENLDYSGKGIANRQAVYNGIDYQGAAFNYNTRLNKTNLVDSYQQRTNISVVADDASIKSIDLLPTGSLAYRLESSSNGVADLKFRHRGSNQFLSPNGLERREEISEGDERYIGEFNIVRSTFTNMSHMLLREPSDYLPCCMGGFEDMSAVDKKQFKSAYGVFDCTCFEVPKTAQFTGV